MKTLILKYTALTKYLEMFKSVPLLLLRLALAYGFYSPALMKWKNIHEIAEWFSQIGIPAPAVNAYLAAIVEAAGVVFLTLGLGVRVIAVPLMVTMFVAIKTVHWANGFDAGNNGYEIPLYYLLMLLTLFMYGGGKLSLDHLIQKNNQT